MSLLISLYLKSAVEELPESRSYQNGIIDIPYRALCMNFSYFHVCSCVYVAFKHSRV